MRRPMSRTCRSVRLWPRCRATSARSRPCTRHSTAAGARSSRCSTLCPVSCARSRSARSTRTRRSKERSGATSKAEWRRPRPSWPRSFSTRSRWRSCQARRSARRGTSGSRTRLATTIWPRASAGSSRCCRDRPVTATVGRSLADLPKAHLHLHFTGSMRHATVRALAEEQGIFLPDALTEHWPPELSAADEKGWFRFQRLYDVARSVVRSEPTVRRLVTEAAEDDAAEGSRWLEIQVDPSGYGQHFGGITPFLELVIDAAADATRATGVEVRIVVAANRTRHPMDARTLARLAVQYAGRGVVGFGLSNDERRG